jgi:hypothetical protein
MCDYVGMYVSMWSISPQSSFLLHLSTVSGLWGIFYFHEVEGAATIAKWFLSASVTVLGILLLSIEHHEK